MNKITPKQIRTIRDYYLNRLVGWLPHGSDVIYRIQGVFTQRIWLDRLSYGAYRPTSSVVVFVAPSTIGGEQILSQHLSITYRTTELRAHSERKDNVFRSMVEEFRPPLLSALSNTVLDKTLEKLNDDQINVAVSYGIAHWKAYMLNYSAAAHWIERFRSLNARIAYPDEQREAHISELELRMGNGTVEQYLQETAEKELEKSGLAP